MKYSLLIYSVFIAVIINIVLPLVANKIATPEQIVPPDGAHNLSFFDQITHMLVHHSHVPVTSSIIVAIIVAISVCIATMIETYM
tara:strand:- start:1530 stop:1784 length:255 start_codon:yes stop_codon:yes gene_type:complete